MSGKTHLVAGIADKVVRSSGYGRIVVGILLFIGICAFGKEQPHRSFMHSFLALVLLCIAIGLVWEKAVIYFKEGYRCDCFMHMDWQTIFFGGGKRHCCVGNCSVWGKVI